MELLGKSRQELRTYCQALGEPAYRGDQIYHWLYGEREFAIERMDNLTLFLILLPVLGFFTNGVFGLFTIWLPEMFPSALRGAGSGFAFSLGRVLGAAGPTLIGALAASTGSYPLAISLLSLIYVVGLPLIAMAPETANRPLAK